MADKELNFSWMPIVFMQEKSIMQTNINTIEL